MRASKALLLALISMLVSSCSTELFDQNYAPYPEEFDAQNGVVTIFRESHFVGMAADCFISVGAQKFGDIGNGAGVRIGLPPGRSAIEVHTALLSDTLSIPINVESGKEYYVELAAQAPFQNTMGAVPYILSNMKSHVDQFCNSSWCAALEDKATALPKLEKIQLRERIRKSSF